MVPILKQHIFLLFFLLAVANVSGLNCSNFENPDIQGSCEQNKLFFQDKSSQENKAQVLNAKALNQMSPKSLLSFAQDYNKDISGHQFERFSEDADMLFLDKAWVYIRDPLNSLKSHNSSAVYIPDSGSLKIEKGYEPSFDTDNVWRSYSDNYCSDEFQVIGFSDNLKTFVNGELASKKERVRYGVDDDVKVKSEYSVSSKVEIKENAIKCISDGESSCREVCKTVGTEKRVLTENFVDQEVFRLKSPDKSDFELGFRNKTVIWKIDNSHLYKRIRLNLGKSNIILRQDSSDLTIDKSFDKIQPLMKNSSLGLKNSEGVSKFEKITDSTYKLELSDDVSKCEIYGISSRETRHSFSCELKKYSKPDIMFENISRYYESGEKRFRFFISVDGVSDVSKLEISYDGRSKILDIDSDRMFSAYFSYKEAGMLEAVVFEGDNVVPSKENYFVSWQPINAKISVLLSATAALFVLWRMF